VEKTVSESQVFADRVDAVRVMTFADLLLLLRGFPGLENGRQTEEALSNCQSRLVPFGDGCPAFMDNRTNHNGFASGHSMPLSCLSHGIYLGCPVTLCHLLVSC
jgi:hypothetical protein